METPATDTNLMTLHEVRPGGDVQPGALAPAWHTVVLITAILALSVSGASRLAHLHSTHSRLATYVATGGMELAMLGWVALGLRLNNVALRSLFGEIEGGLHSIVQDVGIAFAFWMGSLTILSTLGILWFSVEAAVARHYAAVHGGHAPTLDAARQESVRALAQLAPVTGQEIAGWVLLCLLVGVVEETLFRGYLQRQFAAWARGSVVVGVVLSAALFGAAHGYQGLRSMVLLAVFGLLFSVLALFRRSLRPCIFAHSLHDLIAGVTLGLLKSHHLI